MQPYKHNATNTKTQTNNTAKVEVDYTELLRVLGEVSYTEVNVAEPQANNAEAQVNNTGVEMPFNDLLRLLDDDNATEAQPMYGPPVAGPDGEFLGFADDNGDMTPPQTQLPAADREATLNPESEVQPVLKNAFDPSWF